MYSNELGISVYVDPVTREQVEDPWSKALQIGGGLFDSIFSAAGKQTAKQLATEITKNLLMQH